MSQFPASRVEAATDAIVVSVCALSGGEIGETWRARLDTGRSVAVKTGPAPLDVEARSLRRLDDHGLPTPDVVFADADLLVLEYVPTTDWTATTRRAFGRTVARLHDNTADAYGWQEPTWKGRFRQPNPRLTDWPAFVADARLGPIADAALDVGGIPSGLHDRVQALRDDVDAVLPADPTPRLLHGDVWEHNAIPGEDGVRAVVDPAPWYGHHELELAYAHWCGLDDDFRDGYESVLEPEPEFEDRRPLYETYFALDHAYHFPDGEYDEWVRDRLDRLGY